MKYHSFMQIILGSGDRDRDERSTLERSFPEGDENGQGLSYT
ncbi:hypothetical protein PMG71_06635 [Roseofilum sp. BLCC_M154]|uniref:Uncharacterized protein n=1 Tax=Roseofilum acuticapitatum BLCC-M154 TaxID=3022444 RepID=A0ABT7ARP6_9CYAN|nr:hypothetical protein [Roseofilum acuticapitatum]MDJ1169099.1 hypothetical protein [Roseofilum acuticapitatum BLCC-M154]